MAIDISGQTAKVLDGTRSRPIPNATLSSVVPQAFAIADERGRVDLTAFEGSQSIEIRSAGYRITTMSYDSIVEAGLEIRLQIAPVSLDQVVISASGWTEDKRVVGRYIVPIRKEKVAFLNPQTTADLLGTSGSVFIQKSQQGGGSPMIRGFATNRLLYSVDGVRMNTAIFRSGNIHNVISLDPFALQSTEVLFGPGSVIYGSDAIGGVMRFETLNPEFAADDEMQIGGNAALRYSSANDEQTAHVDLNVGWKKWALLTSFSNFNFDDLRMGSHGPESHLRTTMVVRDSIDKVVPNPDPQVQIPTGYGQMNFMQKVRFKPSTKLDLQYAFHYSETSSFGRYDRLLRLDAQGLPAAAEWNYGPQRWMMNHLQATFASDLTFFDKAVVRFAHQYFNESRSDRRFNRNIRNRREESVHAYSLNLDLVKNLGSSRLYYGVELVRNDVVSTGTSEDIHTNEIVVGPARYPNAEWNSAGVYASLSHVLSDQLTLNTGLRYNFFGLDADFTNNTAFFPFPFERSSSSDGNLTGSAGLSYRPGERITLSVLAATGFRSPNVDDIGKVFDSERGSVVVPNPNLKAEYIYNGEVGVAWLVDDILKFDFTAYYSVLENAMVRRNFTLNGLDSIVYDGELSQVQAIQNASSATVFGVQMGLEARFKNGLTLESTYNYQNGEEEMDDGATSPSRHAAPAFGLTRIGYEKGPLKFQVFVVYSAEVSFASLNPEERGKPEIYARDADGNPYSPSWYTLNFKMSWQINQALLLGAGIENITDQRYRPYSSGLVAPGRNIVLSLRAGF
jgi:hemoglobin/transferrin/lactoferrin receptor protein